MREELGDGEGAGVECARCGRVVRCECGEGGGRGEVVGRGVEGGGSGVRAVRRGDEGG